MASPRTRQTSRATTASADARSAACFARLVTPGGEVGGEVGGDSFSRASSQVKSPVSCTRTVLFALKSQPRTGHTREPNPTNNALKHTTTRKTATHERNPDAPHVHTHTHTHTSRHITSGSATPMRERSRQGNHRLRDLHRLFASFSHFKSSQGVNRRSQPLVDRSRQRQRHAGTDLLFPWTRLKSVLALRGRGVRRCASLGLALALSGLVTEKGVP